MVKRIFQLLLILYVFFFAIELMGDSFIHLGKDAASSIIEVTSNPFISFFIGLLATALIQSSSTTTSLAVAAVASGSITVANAVPMVMGANIGTSLTSTIVSLGFITDKKEFRKAISGGVIHDFFNIFATLIFLPLEITYKLLSKISIWTADLMTNSLQTGAGNEIAFHFRFAPYTKALVEFIDYPLILFLLAFGFLFGSIKLFSNYIYQWMVGKSENVISNYLFGKPLASLGWGTLITAGIQSSSITTSLVVPFVATSRIRLQQAFYFVMGANIGTTITAFLVAIFRSQAALSLAFTHLIFNVLCVSLFLAIPWLREMLIVAASKFGKLTMKNRFVGFIYILLLFFLIPFLLIYLYKSF